MIDGVTGPTPLVLELGDRIDYGGMIGTVELIEDDCWHEFPVKIKFDEGATMHFTADGRQFLQQRVSLLKIIGKVKPKKKYWRWVFEDAQDGWVVTEGVYDDKKISPKGIPLIYSKQAVKIEASEIEL